MKKILSLLTSSVILIATGCATMFDGKTQTITVNSSPPQADCVIKRQGVTLGEIDKTPGSILIEKSGDDLFVACAKNGYGQGSATDKSGLAGWVWANILIGGIIGLAVDYGTGAINKYDPIVSVTLPASSTAHP